MNKRGLLLGAAAAAVGGLVLLSPLYERFLGRKRLRFPYAGAALPG